MLGVRLRPEEEERLSQYARDSRRSKSAIVRDWIVERLDREAVDQMIRRAAALHAAAWTDADQRRANANTQAHLLDLDADDGGYDWGPEGPPPPR